MAEFRERLLWSRFGALAAGMAAIFVLQPGLTQAQTEPGEGTFNTVCIACHTVGAGPLIGPDLVGVELRRSEEWIIDFVQGSQAMVNSGDPDAVALFDEYRIPMPDNPLSDDAVRDVLGYMRTATESGTVLALAASATLSAPATPTQIVLGQAIFQGPARLMNGGPTCISCHDLHNDAVVGGGVLATELTTAFARLGGGGIRAILGSPPFPVMQQAYAESPLTEDEIVALAGFLEQASGQQSFHRASNDGIWLFVAGIVGAAVLLGLYTLMWGGRRKGSVHQAIYDRQVRST
jgi:mono/diheme cytochrome c family protein